MAAGLPGAAPEELPALVGFAVSRFGPLVSAVVTACLSPSGGPDNHVGQKGPKTAVVLATMYGDAVTVDTATQRLVAQKPPNPLLFYQSANTSVLSHVTRRYGIHGPLTCVSAVRDPAAEALRMADALLDDPALSQVLVVGVETRPNERVRRAHESTTAGSGRAHLPVGDAAAALLLRRLGEDGTVRLSLLEKDANESAEPGPLGWLSDLMGLCAAITPAPRAARGDTFEFSV
ncbi:ketosynthase [Streptomyces sp. NPDC002838]|uniref:ketosynthase n=1 Tax=Streptomyces sp. NPDC002838 TaxID=3154436 RepID=UPI00331C7BFE